MSCTTTDQNSSFYPCDDPVSGNQNWNAFNGADNVRSSLPTAPTAPSPWPYNKDYDYCHADPSLCAANMTMTGFASQITYQTINAAIPNPPQSGNACHPRNTANLATAATSPHVAYDPASGRYFMAFDANINTPDKTCLAGEMPPNCTGPLYDVPQGHWSSIDNWRVMWAVSSDGGSTWNISPNFLLRFDETWCDAGYIVNDLMIENGNFYLFVSKINTSNPDPSEHAAVFLVKSPVVASETYGYTTGTWQLATPPSANSTTYNWQPINFDGSANWGVKKLGALGGVVIGEATSAYGFQAFAVQKVYNKDPQDLRYGQYEFVALQSTTNPNVLELWKADSLEHVFVRPNPQQPTYITNGSGNIGTLTPGGAMGWCPTFTRYTDGTTADSSGFDLWLTRSAPGARNIEERYTVSVHGDIFPN